MRRGKARQRGARGSTVPKPRRPSLRDLDKACREYVFQRDGGRCLKCQSPDQLQWAHVYTRRYRTVRHHPWGSMLLCAGCHLWWHKEPLEATLWLSTVWPKERIEELREARRRAKPPSPEPGVNWAR